MTPETCGLTVTVAAGVTVPRASSVIGTSATVAVATPTVVAGRPPRPPPKPPGPPGPPDLLEWLSETALGVYVAEYGRTGFQGGLQAYRRAANSDNLADTQTYAGRTVDVPTIFVSGASDWGVYQAAGALEAMQQRACTHLLGVHLIEGAGHWVQQEQPEATARLLLDLLGVEV